MAAQTTLWNLTSSVAGDAEKDRQRKIVINHLMKAAFGDPQVHRRMQASADFRAGLHALDPDLPDFIQEEGARNVIMIGCLHMIDSMAALLKFARENNIPMEQRREEKQEGKNPV